MTKTFLDSGVLLTAWRGKECADQALSVLEDATREFVSSQMVRLELLPKPKFFKQSLEVEFYETHLVRVVVEEPLSCDLGDEAMALASTHGVAAADAINVRSAIRLGAEEFITSQKPGKPVFRVPGIKIVSLHSLRYPHQQPGSVG